MNGLAELIAAFIHVMLDAAEKDAKNPVRDKKKKGACLGDVRGGIAMTRWECESRMRRRCNAKVGMARGRCRSCVRVQVWTGPMDHADPSAASFAGLPENRRENGDRSPKATRSCVTLLRSL